MKLTKLQKQYLSRRACAFCEQPLDRLVCYTSLTPDEQPCTLEQLESRQLRCLKEYKPRKSRGLKS